MNHLKLRSVLCAAAFSTLGATMHAQTPEVTVRAWMLEHHAELGLTDADAASWVVTDVVAVGKSGTQVVHIQQMANGLPVFNAVANFAVRHGQVMHEGDRLIADLATKVMAPVPGMDAAQAVHEAADQLGLAVTGTVTILRSLSATAVELSPSGISQDPITAQLIYQPVADGAIMLAWDLTIRSITGRNWWHLAVDARTGRIIRTNDYIAECAVPKGSFTKPEHVPDACEPALPEEEFPAPAPDGYRVFPLPVESPNHGARALVSDPADVIASPFGWHDDDGVPGAEYTITRGNNVYASDDMDADNQAGYSPDGGPTLEFDFPLDLAQNPAGYLDASITNLFYWCNILHDVWYQYGFDEASGNFQTTNYGGGGADGDPVLADAQDGSGTDNANFATPPDGVNGRMQMYDWGGPEIVTTLTVNDPTSIAGDYVHEVALFGPAPPAVPLIADMVVVMDDSAPPNDGCGTITNAAELVGKIVLVDRGACPFTVKAQAIQDAGGAAVVIANNQAGAPIAAGGTSTTITIPVVMISNVDGALIKSTLLSGTVNATLQASATSFDWDSDLDNGVIAHEYGHGISTRLTGGPGNSDCLQNAEQMGEGWSDWIALMLTLEPGDQGSDVRGIASYLLGEPVTGTGLRPAPYSTDLAVNDLTYAATNDEFGISQPHGIGFVWATMLWDLTWALIQEHGFDPDVYHGTGGNNIAMQLVIDGMKLQPCSPGFVDGRDAILQADSIDYDGANHCLIWRVFASRGLGYSADQGSSDSRTDQVEAFDLPLACLQVGVEETGSFGRTPVSVAPNPTRDHASVILGAALNENIDITVFSVEGRVVRTAVLRAGQTTVTFDLSDLAPATYTVTLRSPGASLRRSIVVIR